MVASSFWLLSFSVFVFGGQIFDASWVFLAQEFGLQSHFWLWILSVGAVIVALKVAASVISVVIGLFFLGGVIGGRILAGVATFLSEVWE